MIIPHGNLFDMYRSRRALRWELPLKGLTFVLLLLMVPEIGVGQEPANLSGTFSPVGTPVDVPVRIDAGPACIVDLTQRYEVVGALAGSMEIDYRIQVHGPCGSPAGTFLEEWIAFGTFAGRLEGEPAAGNFVYTATVQTGGEVSGTMEFGGGLEGKLTIRGAFSDQKLTYLGALEPVKRPPSLGKAPGGSGPEGTRRPRDAPEVLETRSPIVIRSGSSGQEAGPGFGDPQSTRETAQWDKRAPSFRR